MKPTRLPSPDLIRALVAYRDLKERTERAREVLYAVIRSELADGHQQVEVAASTGFTREHIRRIARAGN